MSVPDDVREAMARAIARAEHDSFQVGGVGEGLAELDPEAAFDCYVDHVDAALSALEAAGWVCVPVEPTEEMLKAAFDAFEIDDPKQYINGTSARRAIYAAMLTASRHKEKNDG